MSPNPRTAIADFTEAIRLDANLALAYYSRGNAYGSKGADDKAIADFTEAIRLNPKYANAYCNRGGTYGVKGEFDKAIADFTEAIRLAPNDALAYYYRGSTAETLVSTLYPLPKPHSHNPWYRKRGQANEALQTSTVRDTLLWGESSSWFSVRLSRQMRAEPPRSEQSGKRLPTHPGVPQKPVTRETAGGTFPIRTGIESSIQGIPGRPETRRKAVASAHQR